MCLTWIISVLWNSSIKLNKFDLNQKMKLMSSTAEASIRIFRHKIVHFRVAQTNEYLMDLFLNVIANRPMCHMNTVSVSAQLVLLAFVNRGLSLSNPTAFAYQLMDSTALQYSPLTCALIIPENGDEFDPAIIDRNKMIFSLGYKIFATVLQRNMFNRVSICQQQ